MIRQMNMCTFYYDTCIEPKQSSLLVDFEIIPKYRYILEPLVTYVHLFLEFYTTLCENSTWWIRNSWGWPKKGKLEDF